MKKIIGSILLLGFVYLIISFFQFLSFLDSLGECGMSYGPCEGVDIEIELNEMKIDEYVEIPNGRLIFINIENEHSPILVKLNNEKKIDWAKQLITETGHCDLPMYKMEIVKMEVLEDEVIIRIFNRSFSEPGEIYLDKNYNFKMMCLRPF